MKISKIIAILLSLLLSVKAYAGPLEDGFAAYDANNYTVAFEKFRLAAAQGNSGAQYNLGFMYEKGQGVVQDYAEAVKWHKLAAAQGNSFSQFDLGRMYMYGKGVVQDYAEAVKWHKLAAAQGDSDAKFILGLHYVLGRGVVIDDMLAHMWFNLAAAQGHEKAIKYRDDLATVLTTQQITQAQNLARTCQSSKFTKCSNPYGAPVPKQAARPTQQPRTVYVPVPARPIAAQNDSLDDPFDPNEFFPKFMHPKPPKKSTTCRRNDFMNEITCTEN